MIGVRFTRAMRPYGQGDVAMLPEEVAQRVVDDGDAELHDMPEQMHAHEAGFRPEVTKPMRPAQICAPEPAPQTYLTKGRTGRR